MRLRRHLAAAAAALAALAPAALGQGTTPTTPTAPAPPVVPLPEPHHPALDTGWATTLLDDETLRVAPDVAAAAAGVAPSTRIAGRAQAVGRDAAGAVWVRLAYPGRLTGWVPGEAVVALPAPAEVSPATRRALTRATASLGRRSALVVRDPWGRTVFAAGTQRPLSIASVTKLATVSAALTAMPLDLRSVAAILGPSDNDRAQALSNRLGAGSRARGARLAVEHAAAIGAGWALVDGSGLSPANRASAGEVADLLLGVREEPGFRTFFRGMPVAGRSGTLQWRMRGSAADGRVRAKTGTLFDNPTSALAGYVWPAGSGLSPDRAYVFAALENGVSPYRARPVQDVIATALAARGAFTRG
ncbi:MAG: D-alanyl-D-alanine carboxypeptidase [Thermoleophilia bacterium]